MHTKSPSRRELQALFRTVIARALEGVPVNDGRGACRVARALVGEALLILDLAGGGRELAVHEIHRVLVNHYSGAVVGPLGNPLPLGSA